MPFLHRSATGATKASPTSLSVCLYFGLFQKPILQCSIADEIMVRTVSFVQSHTFNFDGSLFQEAITLADFDNDGTNELCIGNVAGDLAVFKENNLCWGAHNLGMITCLGIGDIKNKGDNSLVVITGEGLCYIFDHDYNNELLSTESSQNTGKTILSHSHKQRFPLNIKQLIIADVTNRGANDLIVILDTIVRIYSWDDDAEEKLKHQDKEMYNFERQIDAITVNTTRDGSQSIFVCIPSEGIRILKAARTEKNQFVQWDPLAQNVKLSSPVTDAIGNVRSSVGGGDNMVCFATLDGLLKMYHGDEELWSLPLDNPIFALVKTDIDHDDTDEVIACSWDGLTFFVDHNKNCVKFKFEASVPIRAFCAGQYAMKGSNNKPALVYVTFSGDVVIFYDVQLTSLGVLTLNDYALDITSVCDSENTPSQKHRAKIIRSLLKDCQV